MPIAQLNFQLGLPDHLKFFQGHFVFQEIRWTTFMGVRRGGKTGFCLLSMEIGTKIQKMLEIWSQHLDSDQFNSCNNTLFTSMALTLHKSQLHCSGMMQWWACCSFMSTPSPADLRCETCDVSALFYCFSKLRNNNMATNLQNLISSYDNLMHFIACAGA